jgi:hypothetical protein
VAQSIKYLLSSKYFKVAYIILNVLLNFMYVTCINLFEILKCFIVHIRNLHTLLPLRWSGQVRGLSCLSEMIKHPFPPCLHVSPLPHVLSLDHFFFICPYPKRSLNTQQLYLYINMAITQMG